VLKVLTDNDCAVSDFNLYKIIEIEGRPLRTMKQTREDYA